MTHTGAFRAFDGELENQQCGIAKTMLDLPCHLFGEAELRTVKEVKGLNDIISDLLRKGLGQTAAPLGQVTGQPEKIPLPLFSSTSKAPARRMSLDELVAAEKESLTCYDLERLRTSA